MGLFDKILGGSDDAPFRKEDGFAAVLLAVIAADGHISDEEVEDFKARVNRMRLFVEQSGPDFSAMIDRLFRILRKQGVDELIRRAAPALPQDLRETAFAVAVDMVFADGRVEEEEKTFITRLQGQLGISNSLASQMVDVMAIKNRG